MNHTKWQLDDHQSPFSPAQPRESRKLKSSITFQVAGQLLQAALEVQAENFVGQMTIGGALTIHTIRCPEPVEESGINCHA